MIFVLKSRRYFESLEENPYKNLFKQVTGYYVDKRTTDDPRKIPAYSNNPEKAWRDWYETGEKHRIIDGWITRDRQVDLDLVELNSMDELQEFLNKVPYDIEIDKREEYRVGEVYIQKWTIMDEYY